MINVLHEKKNAVESTKFTPITARLPISTDFFCVDEKKYIYICVCKQYKKQNIYM